MKLSLFEQLLQANNGEKPVESDNQSVWPCGTVCDLSCEWVLQTPTLRTRLRYMRTKVRAEEQLFTDGKSNLDSQINWAKNSSQCGPPDHREVEKLRKQKAKVEKLREELQKLETEWNAQPEQEAKRRQQKLEAERLQSLDDLALEISTINI